MSWWGLYAAYDNRKVRNWYYINVNYTMWPSFVVAA